MRVMIASVSFTSALLIPLAIFLFIMAERIGRRGSNELSALLESNLQIAAVALIIIALLLISGLIGRSRGKPWGTFSLGAGCLLLLLCSIIPLIQAFALLYSPFWQAMLLLVWLLFAVPFIALLRRSLAECFRKK